MLGYGSLCHIRKSERAYFGSRFRMSLQVNSHDIGGDRRRGSATEDCIGSAFNSDLHKSTLEPDHERSSPNAIRNDQ